MPGALSYNCDGRPVRTVPNTYVVCTKDNTVPVALQLRLVRGVNTVPNTPTTAVKFDTSHSPLPSQSVTFAMITGVC